MEPRGLSRLLGYRVPAERGNIHVIDNPALQSILLELRDRSTPRHRFRELLELAGLLLGYEAGRLLSTRRDEVETPLGVRAQELRVADEELSVIAVLRAALPMAMGVVKIYPRASLGFVAASRLEDTGRTVDGRMVFDVNTPYWKLPTIEDRDVILVDPMLATGSTLARVAERVAEQKPRRMIIISLIATMQGIERVLEAARTAYIVTAAVDPALNEHGFIVPGLGDAGDRCFG
ncbi:MAG TPA: uracil phosphoribosyltransferase [Pyrodictium sp.]|nr:uracil phosphoribosyltransferase [Pyrodictium sp.]